MIVASLRLGVGRERRRGAAAEELDVFRLLQQLLFSFLILAVLKRMSQASAVQKRCVKQARAHRSPVKRSNRLRSPHAAFPSPTLLLGGVLANALVDSLCDPPL